MKFDKNIFLTEGFLVYPNYYSRTDQIIEEADKLLNDSNYKFGMKHVNNDINELPKCLQRLVYTKEVSEFFSSLEKNIKCRDTMITHEFKSNQQERNGWLHFDRWRSFKALVYLTDVTENDGPFSVVPRTQDIGKKLRRSSVNQAYVDRPNRIKLDYPNFYKEPIKIIDAAGTLILFDTDVFHEGGKVKKDHQRKLIRSHWYPSNSWREIS